MRKVVAYVLACLFVLAIASSWALGWRLAPPNCGCAASKGGCIEPCSDCCGPNGYADCWKRPNPSRRP